MHEILQHIITGTLSAIDPVPLVRNLLTVQDGKLVIREQEFDLSRFRSVHILGAGKASVAMFLGLEAILSSYISGGLIVSLPEHAFRHSRVSFLPGDHPIPGYLSETAGEAMLAYIRTQVSPEDLVIFLMSGGASSLLVKPAPTLTLDDKIQMNRLLLHCGAAINEINTVRKHLSAIKGGKLGELIAPARLICLVISDVVGSSLEVIGSGITYGDSSTFRDTLDIIRRYELEGEIPLHIMSYIQSGVSGEIADTPAPSHAALAAARHFIIAENATALHAAAECAKASQLMSVILTDSDQGLVRDKANEYAKLIRRIAAGRHANHPPILMISGGEHTVKVTGKGRGGRNTEFILALLNELSNFNSHEFEVISIGTDGIDGGAAAAGAWINDKTMPAVLQHNLDINAFLADNNSYEFFRILDQLIVTGPTNTNVMDMRLIYLR